MEGILSSKARTRVILGCEACRIRHVKCDDSIPSCTACATDGIKCVRSSNIRFKKDNSHGGSRSLFHTSQVWVDTEGHFTFCDETAQIKKLYKETDTEAPNQSDRRPLNNGLRSHQEGSGSVLGGIDLHLRPILSDYPAQNLQVAVSPSQAHGQASPAVSLRPQHESPHSQESPISSTNQRYYASPASFLSGGDIVVPYTDRQAVLMRNYIENMALWADITDPDRHFETEVPRRALFYPVLRYAIFAFSSQHMNRELPDANAEALEYYNRCLSILIPTLSSTGTRVSEEVHAAVAILRQYEEMDSKDEQFHLTGATQIVNSMQSLDFAQGLGEASAWLCLRQDIYISINHQTPLKTNLSAFAESETFHRREDTSYAARMVFLLAKAVACAHSDDSSAKTKNLEAIAKEVEEWYTDRPLTFVPIMQACRDVNAGRVFPVMWMALPCQVIGLQYYYIAKILILLFRDKTRDSGIAALREGRKTEKIIRDHLRHVVGLAISNLRAQNTLFSARHALEIWGGVFDDRVDQEAVERFLIRVQETTGWRTEPMISALRLQWAEE